jgi:heme exporter protein C
MSGWKTWWHRLGSPRWFYRISGPWAAGLIGIGLTSIAIGFVWGLAIAPPDYLQGNSFRIMYLHVPAAMLAESCYVLMGIAGAVLLIWRMKLADVAVMAAAPIGALFCALALVTGSIWGRPTWGTWWVWDARTTSMLVLLFLYFGYMALAGAVDREGGSSRIPAIFGLIGAINIPIIHYSVIWWNSLHQPPSITTGGSAMAGPFLWGLLAATLGYSLLFGGVVLARMRALLAEIQTEARLRRKALEA